MGIAVIKAGRIVNRGVPKGAPLVYLRAMHEDSELIKFFDWVRVNEKFDSRFSAIYHVANERCTSMHKGKIFKQKGVRSGVPDVHVPIPSGMYPGLFIEFKIRPNTLSDSQKGFIKTLLGLGYLVVIAWSADEAIEIVREYLEQPAKMVN